MKERTKTYLVGAVVILLSCTCISIMSMMIKLTMKGNEKLASFQLVSIRCFYMWVFTVAALKYDGVTPFFGPRDKIPLLIARGVFGFLSLSCYFYGFSILPLAETVPLSFTAPIWTAFLAFAMLKEPLSAFDLAASLCCVAGVIMIARPPSLFPGTESEDHVTGGARIGAICIALLGAVLAAAAYVTVRKVGKDTHPLVLVQYFAALGTVIPLFIAWGFQDLRFPTEASTWLYLNVAGVTGFLGQWSLNKGFQILPASRASALLYVQVPMAFIWDHVIFDDKVSPWSVGGSAVVFLCVGLTTMKNVYMESRKADKLIDDPNTTSSGRREAGGVELTVKV